MKRLMVIVICVTLLSQLFSGLKLVEAATATGMDIIISNYSLSGLANDYIQEGQSFKLTMTFKNNTLVDLSNIIIEIDPTSSFYGTYSNTIEYTNNIPASSPTAPVPLDLTYSGTGKSLKFNVKYKKGTDQYEEAHTLTISKAYPTDSGNTTPTPTDTSKYKPTLTVVKGSSALTATAGATTTLNLSVKNTSIHAAKSVIVSLEMEKAAQVLENLNLTQVIDQISYNETKNAVFGLKILSTAPEGTYPIKVNFNYSNAYGDIFPEASDIIYIKVQNNNTSPLLAVDTITLNPSAAVPGENADVKISIANLGNLAAKDIKVTLKGMKSNGFMLDNSTDTKYIKNIYGGSSATVTFKLKASSGIPSGSNEMQVKIDYSDESGTKLTAGKPDFHSCQQVWGRKGACNTEYSIPSDLYIKQQGL